jgi:hypothetical protein
MFERHPITGGSPMRTFFALGMLAAIGLALAGCVHEHHYHARADCDRRIVYTHVEHAHEYHGGYYRPGQWHGRHHHWHDRD